MSSTGTSASIELPNLSKLSLQSGPVKPVSDVLCSGNFNSGHGGILPAWLKAVSVRSMPSITFVANGIATENLTADSTYLHVSGLHGDEIGMQWNPDLDLAKRNVSMVIDVKNLDNMPKILQKDQAGISLASSADPDSLIFYVIQSGTEREGVRGFQARLNRNPISLLAGVPQPEARVKVAIQARVFAKALKTFSKVKPGVNVLMTFYNRATCGLIITSMTTQGEIDGIERLGELPDSLDTTEEDGMFQLNRDKVAHLINFASVVNEGVIRFYFSPGTTLKMAYRISSLGEQWVYMLPMKAA